MTHSSRPSNHSFFNTHHAPVSYNVIKETQHVNNTTTHPSTPPTPTPPSNRSPLQTISTRSLPSSTRLTPPLKWRRPPPTTKTSSSLTSLQLSMTLLVTLSSSHHNDTPCPLCRHSFITCHHHRLIVSLSIKSTSINTVNSITPRTSHSTSSHPPLQPSPHPLHPPTSPSTPSSTTPKPLWAHVSSHASSVNPSSPYLPFNSVMTWSSSSCHTHPFVCS